VCWNSCYQWTGIEEDSGILATLRQCVYLGVSGMLELQLIESFELVPTFFGCSNISDVISFYFDLEAILALLIEVIILIGGIFDALRWTIAAPYMSTSAQLSSSTLVFFAQQDF